MTDPAHSYEVPCGDCLVSSDPARLDLDYLFGFLSAAYWYSGLTRERLRRSIAHSINFGLYRPTSGSPDGDGRQIGFARVMGDRTTFAYLADFFVDEEFRGRGLGSRLMVAVHGHPELQGLKRWTLKTRDAHRLYERFGYEMVGGEGGFMVRAP